jgi:hypothetical protein
MTKPDVFDLVRQILRTPDVLTPGSGSPVEPDRIAVLC